MNTKLIKVTESFYIRAHPIRALRIQEGKKAQEDIPATRPCLIIETDKDIKFVKRDTVGELTTIMETILKCVSL